VSLPHPSELVVCTRELSKNYDNLIALDRLSLEIRVGEVVGLLGPNGAGKTTTVNLILGVLSPSSGQVLLFGQDLARHRSRVLKRLNFASAYAGLPRNLTLRENLDIFADLYEIPGAKTRIAEVLDELDLSGLADRIVMQLSAGQRMRAVLAKAVLSRPELLLLDEPTASLDPDTADRVRGYLSRLTQRGVTLLWTSHNMLEVERYCSRVVFLHRGRIVLDGPPRELARRSGQVLVRFKPSTAQPLAASERFNGQPREEENGWHEVATDSEAEAAALVSDLQRQVPLIGLELRQPTLEDLFVRLVREGSA
jgi:ABC-2 type transport system ATP-binding protein